MKHSSQNSPPVVKKANGRPRKNPAQGLPKGVQLRSGTFYYTHAGGKWQNLGKDAAEAFKIAAEFNGKTAATAGTMNAWFKKWKKELEAKVAAKTLSPRTQDDYFKNIEMLEPFFGHMHPTLIEAAHVQEYLDIGRDENRPVRANREKAALSSCMSWMMARSLGGLKKNICLDVRRNEETPRTRYVSDKEYLAVYRFASPVLRCWSELVYRTLQRPSDILSWTRSEHLVEGDDGKLYLRFKQGKTGTPVSIAANEKLLGIFEALRLERERQKVKSDFLICTEAGLQYTLSGITSIWSRTTEAARVKDFGIYDMKSKAATDMYLAGVPLEKIQHLCGHASITTTEIYVKSRIVADVEINDRDLKLPDSPPEKKQKIAKSFGKETMQVVVAQ